MTTSDDRRTAPRLRSYARILWAVLGSDFFQIDRLRDVSATGARVATESLAKEGDEIRFELLDDDGVRFAIGFGRIAWVDAVRGMGVAFLALGVDREVVSALAAADERDDEAAKKKPPPLPAEAPSVLPATAQIVEAPVDSGPVPEAVPLKVRRPGGVIIGIDLGTTNTCASYVVDGRPRVIPGRTGTNTIPSMITFDPDGSWHVGQRAHDRQVMQPLRTIYGSKRLIGRTYFTSLAAELQKHFAFPLGVAEGQRFGARIDDRIVSMDLVATRVLEEVRSTAEAHLGEPVLAAVITVPAYFSEVQRDAVRRAAKDAKLTVHRIVNEPTAAAVAYGHNQSKKARIAVWDLGGGTFDFSIVNVDQGMLEVVATGGDCFVGGADFDDLLASFVLGEFMKASGVEVDPEPQQIARLREASELAKRALSVQTEYVVELPEFTKSPKHDLKVEVTRERFDEMMRPLIERTIAITGGVMLDAGIIPDDIDDVVLVGGTTRIPSVQRAVGDFFRKRPSKRINPDEAVALGAALLADEIGSDKAKALLDVLPMTVGRATSGLKFEAILSRNARLPAERELTIDADLLGSVSVPLFQGEALDASQNEYLCTAVVEDAALREGGRVVVRLAFDEHCVMSVDAKDGKTGRALIVKLDRTRALADVITELGSYQGPTVKAWQPPESRIGKVLGKLFKLFGR